MVTVPPGGVYLTALSVMLAIAWATSWRWPEHDGPWPGLEPQGDRALLGQRLVELGDVAGELGEIEPLPVAMLRAGLGAGDRQQGVEGVDQPSASCSVSSSSPRDSSERGRAHQRHLDPRAHPVQAACAGRARCPRVTWRMPTSSRSIRSSIALRFWASSSNSSPSPSVAIRWPRSPAMIRRGRPVDPLQPPQHPAAEDRGRRPAPARPSRRRPAGSRRASAAGSGTLSWTSRPTSSRAPPSRRDDLGQWRDAAWAGAGRPRRPAPSNCDEAVGVGLARRASRRDCRRGSGPCGSTSRKIARRLGSAAARSATAWRSPARPRAPDWSRSQPTSSSMVSRACRSMKRVLAM